MSLTVCDMTVFPWESKIGAENRMTRKGQTNKCVVRRLQMKKKNPGRELGVLESMS